MVHTPCSAGRGEHHETMQIAFWKRSFSPEVEDTPAYKAGRPGAGSHKVIAARR